MQLWVSAHSKASLKRRCFLPQDCISVEKAVREPWLRERNADAGEMTDLPPNTFLHIHILYLFVDTVRYE